jgi:hypothetical protein
MSEFNADLEADLNAMLEQAVRPVFYLRCRNLALYRARSTQSTYFHGHLLVSVSERVRATLCLPCAISGAG